MAVPAILFIFSMRISVVRLATSSGSPPASHLPLKGKAICAENEHGVFILKTALSINRPERQRLCPCLPLEGKVSAEPTDEVFIQIQHRLYPDREYNANCRRRPRDARPYDLYYFAALSFRKWKYTENLRRK